MPRRLDGSFRTSAKQRAPLDVLLLAMLVAQCACVTTASGIPHGNTPGRYAQATAPVGLDSPSATCRNSLSACAALYGKEVASAAAVLKMVLDETTKKSIEQELTQCAELARSEVLLRHQGQFEKPSPNANECNQPAKNAIRKGVTWAMQLGTEMHEVARECAEERLSQLRPGGFSLEQRYRIDLKTGQKKLVSAEEERALEESGNGGELKGTLKPDVVIHQGDPLNAQAVYDFKFPCVNIDSAPRWNRYPEGHPFADSTQRDMYVKFIAPLVARIIPRLGVVP